MRMCAKFFFSTTLVKNSKRAARLSSSCSFFKTKIQLKKQKYIRPVRLDNDQSDWAKWLKRTLSRVLSFGWVIWVRRRRTPQRFPTLSCRSQSYPLANMQLKPLRTSTSGLDHSESSEEPLLTFRVYTRYTQHFRLGFTTGWYQFTELSILDIRNIFDWLFRRVARQLASASELKRRVARSFNQTTDG